MQTLSSRRLRAGFVSLLLLTLVLRADPFGAARATTHDSCPPGQSPRTIASLGDVLLAEGAPPHSRMVLSRIVLSPGETLALAPPGPTAYYVESGILEYTFRTGHGFSSTTLCESPDGRFSGGGSFSIDDRGMTQVNQGQTLIADLVPTGPLSNGGTSPLVMLQVTLVLPELDPATGLPMPDSVAAARIAAREREAHRQRCRAEKRQAASGTPASDAASIDPFEHWPATPAVSAADWAADSSAGKPPASKPCRNARSR